MLKESTKSSYATTTPNAANQKWQWNPEINQKIDIPPEFARTTDEYRRKRANEGKCKLPWQRGLNCCMDCLTCKYYCRGVEASLDEPIQTAEGEYKPLVDTISDMSTPFEESVQSNIDYNILITQMEQLCPTYIKVLKMKDSAMIEGEKLSMEEIAKKLGIKRTTLISRVDKEKRIILATFENPFRN